MKPVLALCLAAAALCGCSTVSYWDHGEWLDRVSVRPANPVQHTPEEEQALRADQARLRAQADALRQKLASEKNRDQRIGYLRELKDVDDDLHAVEYALQGGPMPRRWLPSFL
jgi:predicted aminopeptidase